MFLTERLIAAQYSQEAEAGADSFAHDVLARAGVSPGALGDMFESFRRKYGDRDGVAAHFLSHPALGARIEAARAAVEAGAAYDPALSGEDWAALRTICD
ncbi:M48 family metalloprotease [Sulfitobacter porphyrae]|uniref:M48 family metalloprotease n=1 Tax=Sulfitobacter porphyrae TaxID=1246864 RepID=A0ABW2AZL8_9RHOB